MNTVSRRELFKELVSPRNLREAVRFAARSFGGFIEPPKDLFATTDEAGRALATMRRKARPAPPSPVVAKPAALSDAATETPAAPAGQDPDLRAALPGRPP